MNTLKINHLAAVVCVIIMFALGFVWYGPLFGEPWMAAVGLDMATIEANPPGTGVWITNTVNSILQVYLIAWLLVQLNVNSAARGAGIAFVISFGLILLSRMTSDMFAQNPYILTWLTAGFNVVGNTLCGALLGGWTKSS